MKRTSKEMKRSSKEMELSFKEIGFKKSRHKKNLQLLLNFLELERVSYCLADYLP
jgi:hypothetical protein